MNVIVLAVALGVVVLAFGCWIMLDIAREARDTDPLGGMALGMALVSGSMAGGGVVWLVWQLFRALVRMAE